MFTKHHPNGEGGEHLNNGHLTAAIARYQAQGDAASLGEIIRLVEPRALALIRFHKTDFYAPEPELLSDVHNKLLKSIGRFDAARGSAFSYVSAVITSTLKTAVSNQRRHWSRHYELDGELVNTLPARTDDWSVADDLIFKIKSRVRTTLTDETEIAAQRWLVLSLCQSGFAAKRHTCCDLGMGIFKLSHSKSRELFDRTLLEVRRAIHGDLKHCEVAAERLIGTRSSWMVPYRKLLTASEFSTFFWLLRGLAPYTMLVLDPKNGGTHRRDRIQGGIPRQHLEQVLYGCPSAKPLFRI
jgi:hypothetical protein